MVPGLRTFLSESNDPPDRAEFSAGIGRLIVPFLKRQRFLHRQIPEGRAFRHVRPVPFY